MAAKVLSTKAKITRLPIVLSLMLVFFGVASLFAGGAKEPQKAVVAEEGSESPILADLVARGDLPSLSERIPEEPLVVEPVDRIGRYGGTMQSGLVGGGDTAWLMRTILYDHLVSWEPDWTGIMPNIARAYDVNDDASEYTFHLRRGMRWSDGAPFTADDIVFWYEDQVMNEELTLSKPSWMTTGPERVIGKVVKIDDHTVRFSFEHPNGLFLQQIAQPLGWVITGRPRHYLENYHIEYNPDNTQRAMAAEGLSEWPDLWDMKVDRVANVDLPVLTAWRPVTPYTGESTRIVWERNPYYWKVDTVGNQLPYIDGWIYDIFESTDVLLLNVLSGDVNVMFRHIDTLDNRPVLFENRSRGDYREIETPQAHSNNMVIGLNMTHDDPVKREIYGNKDFRIGLSHAIDREEIADLLFAGAVTPRQAAPFSDLPFYNEQLATQYLEYDLDLANEYLDRAGFTQRNRQGIRLGPDGNPITITVEVATSPFPVWVDMLELIKVYWQFVGIELNIRSMDRTLYSQRTSTNLHDMSVWVGAGGRDGILDPRWYFPYNGESLFGVRWAAYYNPALAAEPEEPPAATRRQMGLYRQLLNSPPEMHDELMAEILQIAADEFYAIGTVTHPSGFGYVSNSLGNVMDVIPHSWPYPSPAPARLEQWFFDE